MFTEYLLGGVKTGLAAGVVFALLVAFVANPLVVFADEFGHEAHGGDDHHESATDHHGGERGDHSHDSTASLAVTNAVSIVSSVLWAVLLGASVFGVVFYVLEPVLPGTGSAKSYVLAAAGFVTVSGAPWLVLPPQPPGVEQSLSVDTRLLLYGGMMVAGALVCLLSGVVYSRLRDARGRALATVAAVFPFGLLAVPVWLSPANATASALPAELAAGMTGLIVFGQVLLWLLLAVTHARLHDRLRTEYSSTRSSATVTAD